jgi:tRNA (guanine9-N1)-methyltransferase
MSETSPPHDNDNDDDDDDDDNVTSTAEPKTWRDHRLRERERRKQRDRLLNAAQDPDFIARRKARAAKRELKNRDQVQLRGAIVLDCQFDAMMKPGGIVSLTTQFNAVYSKNRLLPEPFSVVVVGLSAAPQLRERMQTKLPVMRAWSTFEYDDRSLLERFAGDDRKRLVYLTAESPNVLGALDDTDVYVVGALVDHNSLPGVVNRFAVEHELRTARLPIAESISLNSRKVLTVNQVCEILCNVRANGGDWPAAIELAIPSRKKRQTVSENAPSAAATATPATDE